jgi:hypothetical protein
VLTEQSPEPRGEQLARAGDELVVRQGREVGPVGPELRDRRLLLDQLGQ